MIKVKGRSYSACTAFVVSLSRRTFANTRVVDQGRKKTCRRA